MPWVSRLLRGERVFARAGADGKLAAGEDGRVDILYKAGGKVYRAAARNYGMTSSWACTARCVLLVRCSPRSRSTSPPRSSPASKAAAEADAKI